MQMPTNKAFRDLTGKTFGKLTVIEYAGAARPDHPSNKLHQWYCLCACGNRSKVFGNSITTGSTKSCGCIQKVRASQSRTIDLIGKQFGKLTVIEKGRIDEVGNLFWICKCDCGKQKEINGASLRRGASKSCGCRQGWFKHGLSGKPGYKAHLHKDPMKRIKHNIGCAVRDDLTRRAKSKNGSHVFNHLPYTAIELKQHLESLFEPWMSWDNYGGKSSSPIKSWQIDHIKPQSSFMFESMNDPEFLECWSLDNLRPLEKIENFKKGNK